MNRRIFWSSTSSSANSCLLAYQWLSQSTMMPVRNPVGRTFCPMLSFASPAATRRGQAGLLAPRFPGRNARPDWCLLRALVSAVPDADVDVGVPPFDRVGRPARPRLVPLHDRPAIDARLDDDQVLDVAGAAVLRVAQRA